MLAAVIWPVDRAVPRSDAEVRLWAWRASALRYTVGFAIMCGAALVALQVIYLLPSDPFQYLSGWRGIYGGHVEGFQGYLAGQLAPRFYSYYIVAFLLKEPIATIVLAVIGLWFVLSDRSVPNLGRTFYLLPPAILVAGYTVMSFDIGIRYLLPALPFAYLLGGVAGPRRSDGERTRARAGVRSRSVGSRRRRRYLSGPSVLLQ
jgi:hypothetical protein